MFLVRFEVKVLNAIKKNPEKWLIAVVIASATLFSVNAQEQHSSSRSTSDKAQITNKSPNQPAPPQSTAGLVMTVDPVTHKVRQATPEEINALAERCKAGAAAQTVPGLARRGQMRRLQHQSGADGVQLDDSYMTSMVATVEPDGKVDYRCDEGKKQGAMKPAGKEKANEK